MSRLPTNNYGADADTTFQYATTDNDQFDREKDLYNLSLAVERHDHSAGRGLAVSRLAAEAVNSAAIAPLAIQSTHIGNLQVTTDKYATASITAVKLAAGVAAANLGFTPVNRAGDINIGNLSILYAAAGQVAFVIRHTENNPGYAFGILKADNSNWELLIAHQQVAVNIPLIATDRLQGTELDLTGSTGGFSLRSAGDLKVGANTGVQAQLTSLNSAIASVVPSGMGAFFQTAGNIPAGWTRFSAADGRMLVGEGSTFGSPSFTGGNSYGSNWTPVTGLTVSGLGGPSETFPVQNGSTQVASAGHTHGSPSVSGQGAQWIPPVRAVCWATKN